MTPWYKSSRMYIEGYELPEFDTDSSPTTVYQHRNVEVVEIPVDPEDPRHNDPEREGELEPTKILVYEERKMSHEEYNIAMATSEFIQLKHENDIVDEYTERLIIEGVL